MSRRVRRLTGSGCKPIGNVELSQGPVTVPAGPDGAGNSNFIEAVELPGRLAEGDLGMEAGLRGGTGRTHAARASQGNHGTRRGRPERGDLDRRTGGEDDLGHHATVPVPAQDAHRGSRRGTGHRPVRERECPRLDA